jgi:hypothetical protein
VPADRLQRVLLVGQGNGFIQTAFSLLPNVELYGATAEEWERTTGKERFDLFVFDGFLPDELPAAPILAIAPPLTSPLGTVTGTLTDPLVGQTAADEPLLRNVDLSRLHVARAQRMELPSWARTVIPGPAQAPLLYSGLRDGLPTAVLAFDLRQSDLPLQVAWPVLASNVAGELLGRSPTSADPIPPASPVELPMGPDVAALRVTRPDGSVVELARSATGASTVAFVDTELLGVYRVEAVPEADPAVSPDPTAAPHPTATPHPTASPHSSASPAPGGSGSPATAPPAGPEEGPLLFAVDLFSPEESNIAPGDGSRIAALGGAPGDAPAAGGVARDEWWPILVVLALTLLLVEWLVYERDGARRIARGVRDGLRGLSLRRRAAP